MMNDTLSGERNQSKFVRDARKKKWFHFRWVTSFRLFVTKFFSEADREKHSVTSYDYIQDNTI